jgi:outer membrane receptor protein involved in Fe transport
MKKIFIITLFVLTGIAAFSQTRYNGKVFDKETNEPLPGVNIVARGTQTGTSSMSDGSFELLCKEPVDSIELRFIGYETIRIKATYNSPMIVAMPASSVIMEAVVVTASRDAQVRGEVPMAISKLNTTTINDAKPTLMTELLNKVPGVAVLNLNNEQHAMSIRQPMGTNAYFLYLEDGIPFRPMGVFNHNAMIEMNIFAVSNIEVVKGPASSLYGPEAVGGAINFITQRPTAVTTARAGVQMDNFGYKRFQYGAGGMVNGKLGYFVGGFYAKQQNSWMTYSDYDKNSVNARFEYELTPATKLILAGSWNDYYSQTPGSVDSISFYNRGYVSTSDFTYRAVNALRVRLAAEHKWNGNNHTTLNLFYRDNSITQNPAYSIRWTTGQSTATGEVNDNSFTSKGFVLQHVAAVPTLKSKIIVGTSLDSSPNSYDSYRVDLNATLRPDGKSVENYSIAGERRDIILADYDAKLLNSALYAQAEIMALRKFTFTIGGRYDNMSFDYTNHIDGSFGEKSYSRVTPKVGMVYQVSDDGGAYANYSLGFAPPGLTSIFRPKPNTMPTEFYYNLTPASFTNYEIGGWYSLANNKVDVDVALYRLLGRNELLNIRQPDNSTDYQSAGRTTHQGIEYGVNYHPNAQWKIRFGGTNAVHRFDEFVLSNKSGDPVQNVNGKIMPSAPSWIANGEVTYKPAFLSGLRVAIEWQRMSSWYQNQINTIKYDDKGVFGLRGISVLNFRAGYQWKAVEVFTNIMNLTDELYAFNVTRGNRTTDRATFTPAPPRTFVVGIQYNFTGNK